MNICFKYNAKKISQRILVEIWKRKILNGIVLIPLTNTSLSEDATGTRARTDGLVKQVAALGYIRGSHIGVQIGVLWWMKQFSLICG
jgi:hypothetical protein